MNGRRSAANGQLACMFELRRKSEKLCVMFSLAVGTWRALSEPKRAFPIALCCGTMALLEFRFGQSVTGLVSAIGLCSAFVGIAPFAWRALFPGSIVTKPERLVIYLGVAIACVFGFSKVLPMAFGVKHTMLGYPSSMLVSIALFLVGGWGLGRDVDMELRLVEERARAERLEREAENAQLLALRNHLDPHFLFNTLNAIAEWCRQDGEVAERAVLQLSALLRSMLEGVKSGEWSLARELGLAKDLFELYLVRDPEMFALEWSVEDVADIQVPALLLLSLAENAVKHGPARGVRGPLLVRVSRDSRMVAITIENPGSYNGPRPGSDGIPTLQKRLYVTYGEDASFSIGEVGNARTRATLRLPVSTK